MEFDNSPFIVGYVTGAMTDEMMERQAVAVIEPGRGNVHALSWSAVESVQHSDARECVGYVPPKESGHTPETFVQTLRSATRIALFVNSGGGTVQTEKRITNILDYIHARSGMSEVYGTDFVGSAAASVYAHAKTRYALEDTTFLFHGTRHSAFDAKFEHWIGGDAMKQLTESRKNEMGAYKEMLVSQVIAKARKRIEWTFDIATRNPENKLLDAFFRGEDLEGFVHRVYARRRDLWNCFVRQCGFSPQDENGILEQFKTFLLVNPVSKS